MIDLAAAALADRLGRQGPSVPVSRRQGTITAVNTGPPRSVDVNLGASGITLPGCRYLASYFPVVGDAVFVDFLGTDPFAIGTVGPGSAWPTYTPIWTSSGGATGGGSMIAAWQLIGRTLDVQGDFAYTGGMTLPAGNYGLSLPAGMTAVTARGGISSFQPGVAHYHAVGNRWVGTVSPAYAGAAGVKLSIQWHGIVGAWGQNIPVAPAAGDLITFSIRLELTG